MQPEPEDKTMTTASQPVAVVTGGARGIGEAVVREFAAQGYGVAVLDVLTERAQALAQELRQKGVRALALDCDVSDNQAVVGAAQAVVQALGPATAVVTCAALIPNSESILEMDLEAHDRMWRVNYHGTVHACRVFAQQMIEAGQGGAIVTLGSINTAQPMPLPAYNPGKVAIARLTQLLAAEVGRHRIRVNCVGPSYVMTPELQARIDSGQRDLSKMMRVHALDTLPTPADVAQAIAFLCSAQARTITGAFLPVDSGFIASATYMTYSGGVPWERKGTQA